MARRKFDRFMLDIHIGTNRKLRQMTASQRWCFVAGVLPIAARAPMRGTLMIGMRPATYRDFAEQAGVSPKVALAMTSACRGLALIEPDDDLRCDRVHDFEEWNPMPKDDPTAAERARRYRERLARHGVITERDSHGVTERDRHGVTPGREVNLRERANALSSSESRNSDDKTTEEDHRLCRLLAELAKTANPKFRVKSKGRWLTDMRLLRERDGNSPEEVERAIRWVFTDTERDAQFWAKTIESPGGLRAHFSQIWAQLTDTVAAKNGEAVEDSAGYLARKGLA